MRIVETTRMALAALRAHKLRSALTLVGIVAGVASIIAVMTGISVIQSTMEAELSVLGTRTFQVQKWPARGFHTNVDWRAIMRRRPITMREVEAVREHVADADLVGAELWRFGSRAAYRDTETEPNVTVCGGTPEYPENNTHYVEEGRNLSEEDVQIARAVAVIGHALAGELFPFTDPIGKPLKLDGRKYEVIGVFEKKASAFGGRFDSYVMIPITRFQRTYGARDEEGNLRSINMTVRARSAEQLPSVLEETRAVLRQLRQVPPKDDDDFTMFTNDSQIRAFNNATRGVKLGAFVIGSIALVVAGIGIMNIMLVSVTERTHEIGIRKAIGAKRRDVLGQFLLEAVVLCNIGGIAGVVVGFALGNLVTLFTEFAVTIPLEWAVRGLLFCTAVGLIFGMWPAVKASRLQPIEALRWE